MSHSRLFADAPSQPDALEALYAAFAAAFALPRRFHNEHCCVSRAHERRLLNTPLREMDEWHVGHVISHLGTCFGTIEELAFLVPRAIEVVVSDDGFTHGTIEFAIFRVLREHETYFREHGVWEVLTTALEAAFLHATARFEVWHPDEAEDRARGWELRRGYTESSERRDMLLQEWFYTTTSVQPAWATDLAELGYEEARDEPCTGWDLFCALWAADPCSARTAHLLDAFCDWWRSGQETWGLTGSHDARFPESLWRALRRPVFVATLLDRAGPAIATLTSPTWLNDVQECLDALRSAPSGVGK